MQWLLSLHILVSTCHLYFDDSYSNRCVVDLTVVLLGIFLMISDVEDIFMYLLATCMSSLEKYLLNSSAHF